MNYMKFIVGRKIGMTQIFDDQGNIKPVTVIQAGPCVVTQVKTNEIDGYSAVQFGFGKSKHPNKPIQGHLKKSDQTSVENLTELKFDDAKELDEFKLGQTIKAEIFEAGEIVNVIGTSKGKGYAGVVKRHGFKGGPGSHGSDFHRAAGSIGCRWPQRVRKGKRMAGHMGDERVTVKGLEIAKVMPEDQLIAILGAIPGPKRSLVQIRSAQ